MAYILIFSTFAVLYFFIRNILVYRERNKFIDFFYDVDEKGYCAGNKLRDCICTYDEMMIKFWIFPLSRFYPAYHNRKR